MYIGAWKLDKEESQKKRGGEGAGKAGGQVVPVVRTGVARLRREGVVTGQIGVINMLKQDKLVR
jgi:hypothetical protein